MATMQLPVHRSRAHTALTAVLRTRTAPLPVDLALTATRIALAWIFIYHGAGKLFGSFNGPGIHRTALYFSDTVHLHPGGFFAVLGGVTEFGGAVALALGVASRLAALGIFGDMVIAMITVSWVNGVNSETPTPGYELNMALAVLAFVIVILGPGRFSIDALGDRFLTRSRRRAAPDSVPGFAEKSVSHQPGLS